MNTPLLTAANAAARFSLGALLSAGVVAAQTPAPPSAPQSDPPAPAQLEKFDVTGTRLKRIDLEGALPVLRFAADDIGRTGVSDVSQFMRMLPQNVAPQSDEAVFGFTPGAAAVNLRGLGIEYTLTLINGRRAVPYAIGSGGTATFSNIQSIPVAAIDHIDVVLQGASAIYGSDAVAGVINYVLKKDFQGFELGATYRNTFETDISTPGLTLTGGIARGKWSAFLNLDWQKRNAQFLRDREWSRSSDHSAVGGLNFLTLGGAQPFGYPAFIRAVNAQGVLNGPVLATSLQPYDTRQLLANVAGTDNYNAAINDPNSDTAASPERERYTAMGNFSYDISDRLSAFLETSFSKVDVVNVIHPLNLDSFSETVAGVGNLVVPAANPYNPLGVNRTDGGAPTDVRVWYSLRDLGNRARNIDNQVTRLVGGFKGQAGDGWEWQSGLMYMRDRVSNVDDGASIRSGLRDALRGATVATAYNLFGAFGGAPAGGDSNAIVDGFRGQRMQDNSYDMWLGDLTVSNGNVFQLPAGPIGIAAGAELRREEISQKRDPVAASGGFVSVGGGSNLFGTRRSKAVFAEVRVPVLRTVELGAAGRYEDYSDFGTAVKPQYSISARPLRWLLVRGAYAQGFRAPALIQLFSARNVAFNSAPIVDPLRQNPDNPGQAAVASSLRLVRGGNPGLAPETSRSYSSGIVVAPPSGWLEGFSASVDWTNIYIYDRIQLPSTSVALRENDPLIVGRAPPTAQDNQLQQPGELVELRLTFQNLAKRYNESLDFGANYRWNSERLGRFDLGWRGSWLYKYVTQSAKSNPRFENRGSTGVPEWRWIGSLGWSRKRWAASFTTNYVGTNNALYQAFAVAGTLSTTWLDLGPWTTYDVQASYELPWLKTTRMTAGAINITDRPPPFYDAASEGFDYGIANPHGAMYYVKLAKRF